MILKLKLNSVNNSLVAHVEETVPPLKFPANFIVDWPDYEKPLLTKNELMGLRNSHQSPIQTIP